MIRVGIVGASGYTGGETLRILLRHPQVEIVQATSESNAGPLPAHDPSEPAEAVRSSSSLHRRAASRATSSSSVCRTAAPCAGSDSWRRWPRPSSTSAPTSAYGTPTTTRPGTATPMRPPPISTQFVYGIPELHRKEITASRLMTGAGCLATASILGLLPLFQHDVLARREVFIEAKVGFLGGAATRRISPPTIPSAAARCAPSSPPGIATRRRSPRNSPSGSRWTCTSAATAIEAVRGILATCHVFLKDGVEEKDIWKVYRSRVRRASRSFASSRSARASTAIPEPKILAGHQLLRHRVREGPPRDAAGGDVGPGQSGEGGRRQRGAGDESWPVACRRRRD